MLALHILELEQFKVSGGLILAGTPFSQDQDANFGILLAFEGALMNILYSAKETQKYGGKTALKYNPLFQLLLGCSAP